MNEKPTSAKPTAAGVPAPRTRLRMQPLAADTFSAFVYACIWALIIGEFIALFWLDLFS